ncbi:MAG: porin family protein [Candidatus Krumholzibacteria bacterium]|nr:porin family protein [Candidatus Krumholzibacteria bacterium]
MKRMGFFLVVLLLSHSAASEPWVSFGAKAGLYSSNTTEIPTGWPQTSFRSGFAGGVYVDYAFNRFFSLQPEILYVMKGLNGGIANSRIDVDYAARFDYIEIPLLAKLAMAGKSHFSPYFFAGPGVGINLAADVDIKTTDMRIDRTSSGSSDWSAIMNRAEFCFSFGGGCKYAIGLGGITADVRFDIGLSKVYSGGEVTRKTDGYETTEVIFAGHSKNFGFALLTGYNF